MINQVANCATPKGNTGKKGCDFNPQNIVGALFFNSPTEFEASDNQALLTALEAATLIDNPYNRLYPVNFFTGSTFNNEDTVTTTSPYGIKLFVRNGKYDGTFTYNQGGIALSNALYGSYQRYFLLIDGTGKLIGTKGSTGTKIAAIPTDFYEGKKATINTGAAPTEYSVNFQWNPDYTNILIVGVDLANDGGLSALQGITGLIDINLYVNAPRVAGVVTVKGSEGFGGYDLYSDFATQLNAVGAWVATNVATGAVINISSVALNTNAKGWTITFDTTDPDYAATTTAGSILLSLIGPTELNSAPYNVAGYESNKIRV